MTERPLKVSAPRNSVAFNAVADFASEVRRLSGAAPHDLPQVVYLAKYLQGELNAELLVVEDYYIDRHFMEESVLYYASCLIPRRNYCARIHAFRGLTKETLTSAFETVARDPQSRSRVEELLTAAYCGFVVVRPLPSVPIGRTVLVSPTSMQRQILTVSRHRVHLLGFELSVDGVAFQQQDRAVAACATTAMWIALQRVCRKEGTRTVTPARITEAAVKHSALTSNTSAYPGLAKEQMWSALRLLDFPPDVFHAINDPDSFMLYLSVYLRSGIPVILALRNEDGGHAFVATGYRSIDCPNRSLSPPCDVPSEAVKEVEFRNLRFDQLYVHDDRIGPYARVPFAILPPRKRDAQKSPILLTIEWPPELKREADVFEALEAGVPLYPKLRTRASELHAAASRFVAGLVKADADKKGSPFFRGRAVGIEMFFERSGNYQSGLFRSITEPKRLWQLQSRLALSRYVGVVRLYIDGIQWLDTVWDTTDRIRTETFLQQLIAIVALHPSAAMYAEEIARDIDVVYG